MSGPLLRCCHIGRRFGGVVAVNDVTFEIGDEPQVTSLIGPNGAGKTTLFNLISCVLPASVGSIWFGDTEITKRSSHEVRHLGLARTYQDVRVFQSLSCVDNVAVAALSSRQVGQGIRAARLAAAKMLEEVGFAGDPAANVLAMSVFQRKQVDLARALVSGPKLLLLDEFLAGLGEEEVRKAIGLITRLIQARGMTVLLIEHVMRTVMQISARVLVLDAGRLIADGPPTSVASDPKVVQAYLGARWTSAAR